MLATILLACVLRGMLPSNATPTEGGAPRDESRAAPTFCSFEIFVDSGPAALAAYQIEFKAEPGAMQIVGIEGGDAPAFKAPPFYDPEAMQHERVVIGAYSTEQALPAGKTRVARVHVMLPPGAVPNPVAVLQTAGGPSGSNIDAAVAWSLVPEAPPAGPNVPSRRDDQKGAL